ncbi:class I SAM-dependent DNA methyltransferase [Kocuria sp.]|uniref:class I SAM-dependent DNA methyltransferase n=1 Tax=Kocuria sp. TaxID=1871328 RepID=UPI0026DEBA09|nr:class I SAM-dependent methyltransferase [Kocuria sp.]MDO5618087.1 class I SAM-dependent methyltransferase [Kocuria sp.]
MTSPNHLRSVYDAAAGTYNTLLPDLRVEQPVDRAMISAFCEEVRVSGNHRVLDAGCGNGRMIAELVQQGLSPQGVDLAPGMIEHARRREPGVDFRVADLRALPYGDREFGAVIAWYSLIHLDYPGLAEALQELARVTAPAGPLLVGFQVGSGSRQIINAYGTTSSMTAWLYSPDELAAVAAGSGWTVTASVTRRAVLEDYDQGFVLAQRA